MEETVYRNEESSLEVHFDGEITTLTQISEGKVVGNILLYKDELEKLKEFIDSILTEKRKYRAVLYDIEYGNLPPGKPIEIIKSIWFDTKEEAEKAGESGLELYGGYKYEIEIESESGDD